MESRNTRPNKTCILATFIYQGLFPTSESPKFIFEISCLDIFLRVFRESPVATHSYSTLLTKEHAEGLSIYGTLLLALKEYRNVQLAIDRLEPLQLNHFFKDCLVCHGLTQRHLSMDGNFRTGKRKQAGISLCTQANQMFFSPGDEVRQFAECQRAREPTVQCSGFKAGDMARSRNRLPFFDETGLMGVFCARHGMPMFFASMFHGERFAYPGYLLKRDFDELGQSNQYFVYYDVACRYESHYKVQSFGLDNSLKCY
jgi:hypothetical protein